jgi:hypothetical protein
MSTMNSISSIRRDIAERLGFAAMGPAPLKGSPARKEEIAQGKAAAADRKKAKLIKDNADRIKDIERDYNNAMSELKTMLALLPKKFAEIRNKAAKGEIDAEDYESDLNEVGRAIEQYNGFLEDIRFSRLGVKVQFALSPSEMKENQRRIETNIRYEAGKIRDVSSNMRFIKDEIERLTAEINNTRDIKRKAKLSLKLDAENKKMKDQVAYLRQARQMIHENQADAKSLRITLDPKWSGNFARPGAKAKFEATPALKNFVRQWNRLEDQNYHPECVLLISKFIGTPQDVANSQRLVKIMDKGFDPSANVELGEIRDRLWKQVRAKYGNETVNKLMG